MKYYKSFFAFLTIFAGLSSPSKALVFDTYPPFGGAVLPSEFNIANAPPEFTAGAPVRIFRAVDIFDTLIMAGTFPEPWDALIEIVGFEAPFDSIVEMGRGLRRQGLNTSSTKPGAQMYIRMGDVIPFPLTFTSPGCTVPGCLLDVETGSTSGDVGIAFSAQFNTPRGQAVYIGYDVAEDGVDYDDLVVKLTVSEVPLPGSLVLQGSMLVAAGFAGWLMRRRA